MIRRHWSVLAALILLLTAAGAGAAPQVAMPAEITVPGDHVFPESLTSSRDGTIYIGSAGEGMIYRVKPGAATAESFVPPSKDLMSVLGLMADDKGGLLYACTDDWSARGTQTLGGKGPATLKLFELKTGKPRGSYEFPGSTGMCNDIAIGKDGAAYVTDTVNPRILRLPRHGTALETWLEDPAFKGAGLDGIAFGGDGNLYVNGFAGNNLFRIVVDAHMKPGAVTEVTLAQRSAIPTGCGRSSPGMAICSCWWKAGISTASRRRRQGGGGHPQIRPRRRRRRDPGRRHRLGGGRPAQLSVRPEAQGAEAGAVQGLRGAAAGEIAGAAESGRRISSSWRA